MNISVDRYKVIPTSKDGIQYELLLTKDGEEFWLPIFCSGTLQAIWKTSNADSLFSGLYSLVRQKLIAYFRVNNEQRLSSLCPLEFNSYNSPHDLPVSIYTLPGLIEVPRDVTVSVKPLSCRVTVFQPVVEISSIRFDIADARDFINSLIKKKYNFKLFEIQEERAIVDMYLPCENKDTFQSRILALANLVSWINKGAIQNILGEKLKDIGPIDCLEVFLSKCYTKFDKRNIIILRSLNHLSWGYPRHTDNERVIKAYSGLSISWPIHDYKLVWEKLLGIYAKVLNELLESIKNEN